MIMEANEMILIETLKDIEPALKEYFAYDRAMLYPEIERMYLATHPAGLHNIQLEDKYRVEVPSTLDELATSDNPFDWQRYAPRVHIPVDTRSAFPVISVQSPVSIQYRWQS